jgi:glutathione synthase/RimK-type ligase-like ATP-grasp enzyme
VTQAGSDRPTLMVLKSLGGAGPESFCPTLGQLAELVVVHERSDLIVGVEAPRMEEAVAPYGVRIDAPTIADVVPQAMDYAAHHHVDGVLSLSEPLLEAGAAIAAELGLPHHPPAAARLMRDKLLQREALASAGVPSARFHKIAGAGDLATAVESVGLPAVLKPLWGAASELTFRIDTERELREGYEEGMGSFRQLGGMVEGHEPAFILEEMLIGEDWHDDPRFGDYVSVEALIANGEVITLCVTDRTPLEPPFRETGAILPSALPDERQAECVEVARAAVEAMGATDGASHTELKLTSDGPRVIEVNGRLGGQMAHVFKPASGVDIIEQVGRIALGMDPIRSYDFSRYAALLVATPPIDRGEIVGVEGFDAVRALPGLLELDTPGGKEFHFDPRLGMAGAPAIATFVADTIEAMLDRRQRFVDALRYEFAPSPAD